jgi:hypothetical protein
MNESIQSIVAPPQQKHKWSISNKQFTPPVKLSNTSNGAMPPIITLNPQLNRSLFHSKTVVNEEFDKESIKNFNRHEEENANDDVDEVCSILSVPSEIRCDRSSQNLDKSNFSALIKKVANSTPPPSSANLFQLPLRKNVLNLTYTKENDASLMLSPCVNGNAPVWSTVNNTILDESSSNCYNINNNVDIREDEENNFENDDAENDKRILYEFIDEMFSKSNGENLNNVSFF